MHMKEIVLIGVGGAAGSILRYIAGSAITRLGSFAFPWGTFVINVAGCLLIGVLMAWFRRNSLAEDTWKNLLSVGFCGGFTTFSSFAGENIRLLESGNVTVALAYIGASLFLGLLAVWIGMKLV